MTDETTSTDYLITIALGPVQDFISAARRTRDLWFGSFMLSEISKAAAKSVKEQGGELIFPNDDADLTPTQLIIGHNPANPNEPTQAPIFNVSNIILARIPAGNKSLPKDLANQAKTQAEERFKQFANAAFNDAKSLIDQSRWDGQINDVLEFYAAWLPLPSVDLYAKTRHDLMLLQAGRKALRDFKPHQGHAKIPKSSLDGARESVLIQGKEQRKASLSNDKSLAQCLRLLAGEELDILGVTKRCANRAAFASVVRVAADPWICGAQQDPEATNLLIDIAKECDKVSLYKDDKTAHTTRSGPLYKESAFPYDGSALFPSRLASLLKPPGEEEFLKLDEKEIKALQTIQTVLLPKLQKELGYGEPEPYLAVLVADGDRMGKALSAIDKMDIHQAFSKQLARFAGEVERIVFACRGCLVYAGGDDVMAFLPVDQCLDCASQLHKSFSDFLEYYLDEKGQSHPFDFNNGKPPTLSVGIAIGHCTEPLEDLLAYGRDAEKSAKNPDRDGLAVSLHTRSGAPVHVRAQWRPDGLHVRLKKWADMHLQDNLSDQAVYGLRQLARDYDNWPKTSQTDEVIKKDIARLFKGKKAGGQELNQAAFQKELDECFADAKHEPDKTHEKHHAGIMRLANEWIIARKIARVMEQAQGKPKRDAQEVQA